MFYARILTTILVSLTLVHAKKGKSKQKKPRDFYKILGLKKSEVKKNPSIIKPTYRRLAKKYHPDKCDAEKQEQCKEKFQDIAAAYETLSDDEKREKYDQFGEEIPGQGGGGGGQPDFSGFEQFFGGGGGGFRFTTGGGGPFGSGFPFGGGDPFGDAEEDRRPERRIFKKTDVPEWGADDFKKNIENSSPGEFYAVAYYRSSEAGDLKDAYVAVQKTFKGVVDLVALNCGQNKEHCGNEKIKSNSPTIVLYYWKEGTTLGRKRFSSKTLTAQSIGNWIRDGLPDLTTPIRTESDAVKVAEDESKAVVMLVTDKKHVPAIIKVLASKFNKHISVGIIQLKKEDVHTHPVAKLFGVQKVPSLFTVTDRESLEVEFFTKEVMSMSYLSLFFSRAHSTNEKKKTEPKTRELTAALYQNGHCAQTVSHFCLVKIGSPTEQQLLNLKELAKRLKSEHVEVYWSTADAFPQLAKVFEGHELVLWRPKRRKWKPFEGPFSVDAVSDFVHNTVNGGAPLPNPLRDEL